MTKSELFGEDVRGLLDQLIADSRLYKSSKDYRELLDFTLKLRNVAPFNAMLLQIQKRGVTHVASAFEWRERFGRTIKERARPLLILWPFAPVVTVYDVLDTEGDPLPEAAQVFPARGPIDERGINAMSFKLSKRGIVTVDFDGGDADAGSIRVRHQAKSTEERPDYLICLNRNHPPATQFVTIVHELAHLFLGHLGKDAVLMVPSRLGLGHAERELEAESVAFIISGRRGVQSKSEAYLNNFVTRQTTVGDLDIYQVMRAAGQVENILGLTQHTQFGPRRPRTRLSQPPPAAS